MEVEICTNMVRAGVTEKFIFKQKLEEGKSVNHMAIWEEQIARKKVVRQDHA